MEWIRVVWIQLLDPLVEQSAQISYMILCYNTSYDKFEYGFLLWTLFICEHGEDKKIQLLYIMIKSLTSMFILVKNPQILNHKT
jgi:hypothetical protein